MLIYFFFQAKLDIQDVSKLNIDKVGNRKTTLVLSWTKFVVQKKKFTKNENKTLLYHFQKDTIVKGSFNTSCRIN